MRSLLALTLALALSAGAAAAEPVRKIVVAAPEGSPWADGLLALTRRTAERTQGRLKVRAVVGGAAGDEVDTARACAEGRLFAWAGSAGGFARQVPELAALELPFLFEHEAEVDAVLRVSPIAPLGRIFERAGFVLVPMLSEVGWRSFAGRKALRTPADFRGLRVRSQESAMHLAMWRALGAEPRAISVLETLSALQAGVVEAFDQSPVYMFATSWYQHARVYTLSRHMYQPGIVVFCKGALTSLSPGDRRIALELAAAELQLALTRVRALEKQVLAQLAAEGLQLLELTASERAALRQRTRPVFDQFRASTSPLGRELLGALERAIEAHRKGLR